MEEETTETGDKGGMEDGKWKMEEGKTDEWKMEERKKGGTEVQGIKNGRLIISRRYDHLPLLPSGPGGVQ